VDVGEHFKGTYISTRGAKSSSVCLVFLSFEVSVLVRLNNVLTWSRSDSNNELPQTEENVHVSNLLSKHQKPYKTIILAVLYGYKTSH